MWMKTIHPEKGSKMEDAVLLQVERTGCSGTVSRAQCHFVLTDGNRKADGIAPYEYLMLILIMQPYL